MIILSFSEFKWPKVLTFATITRGFFLSFQLSYFFLSMWSHTASLMFRSGHCGGPVHDCQCFICFNSELKHVFAFSPQKSGSSAATLPFLINFLGTAEGQLGVLMKQPDAEPGLHWTSSGLSKKPQLPLVLNQSFLTVCSRKHWKQCLAQMQTTIGQTGI